MVQGSAAAITKLACIYIFEELIKNNHFKIVLMCNVVHDEILLDCPKELSENYAIISRTNMEKAGNVFCKRVPLTAEPFIGKTWEH